MRGSECDQAVPAAHQALNEPYRPAAGHRAGTARSGQGARGGPGVRPGQSSPTFITLAASDSTQIGLEDISAKPAEGKPSTFEIGFAVPDVDALYRSWRAAGVTLLNEPSDFPFGRAFDAQDPEGVRLSLYQLRGPA